MRHLSSLRDATFFTLLVVFMLSSHLLNAQTQDQETSRFEVTFAGVAVDQSIFNLWVMDDDEAVPFAISNSRISSPVTIRTTGQLVFYERIENPEPETPPFRAVASVEISADASNYLLLFAVNANGSTSPLYRILPLAEDSVQFAEPGIIRFMNLSSHRIAMRLNEQDRVMERGDDWITRFDAIEEQLTLGLRIAKDTGENWQLGFNSVWTHRPSLQTLLLIVDHPRREGAILARRLYYEPSE